MYKRIISLLVLPLALGATEVCAQSFLNNLKEKGRQKLKEKAEQVINEVFEGEKKEAAAPSPKPSQQASGASVSRQSTSLTPPPSVSTALFEPLGYPTGKGTFEGPLTLPEGTSESKQREWAFSQPEIASLANARLVEEFNALDAWESKLATTIAEALDDRRVDLRDEITRRVKALENFVDRLGKARAGSAGDMEIGMFAEVLESNEYKRTLNSSLAALEPYLSESMRGYFGENGGLDKAAGAQKTKWTPAEPVFVGTSVEGLTGTLTLRGLVDVQGVEYRIYPKENKAVLWETHAEFLAGKDVVIPGHIQMDGKSYPVREIRGNAFHSNAMKSVVIPATVRKIGGNAFANMHCVTSLVIPDSVEELEAACFHSSPELREIYVPNSVRRIGGGCFANCARLVTVTLPEEVSHFDRGQFQECTSLKSVTLPGNLKEIRDMMFNGCSGLEEVVIPSTVTRIGNMAFAGCSRLTSITIPASVTEMGNGAFSRCTSLKSVTLSSRFKDVRLLARLFSGSGIIRPDATAIPDSFRFVD